MQSSMRHALQHEGALARVDWAPVQRTMAPAPWNRVRLETFPEDFVVLALGPNEEQQRAGAPPRSALMLALGTGGLGRAVSHLGAAGAPRRLYAALRVTAEVRGAAGDIAASRVEPQFVLVEWDGHDDSDEETDEDSAEAAEAALDAEAVAAFFEGTHVRVRVAAHDKELLTLPRERRVAEARDLAQTRVCAALAERYAGRGESVERWDFANECVSRECTHYAWNAAGGGNSDDFSIDALARALAEVDKVMAADGVERADRHAALAAAAARLQRVRHAEEEAARKTQGSADAQCAAKAAECKAEQAAAVQAADERRAKELENARAGSAASKARGEARARAQESAKARNEALRATEAAETARMHADRAAAAARESAEADPVAADAIHEPPPSEAEGSALRSIADAIAAKAALMSQVHEDTAARKRQELQARLLRRRKDHVDALYCPEAGVS